MDGPPATAPPRLGRRGRGWEPGGRLRACPPGGPQLPGRRHGRPAVMIRGSEGRGWLRQVGTAPSDRLRRAAAGPCSGEHRPAGLGIGRSIANSCRDAHLCKLHAVLPIGRGHRRPQPVPAGSPRRWRTSNPARKTERWRPCAMCCPGAASSINGRRVMSCAYSCACFTGQGLKEVHGVEWQGTERTSVGRGTGNADPERAQRNAAEYIQS